jgi:GNAT superfamily N-acetyltransferase
MADGHLLDLARELRRTGPLRSLRRAGRSIRRHGLRASIRHARAVGVPYWWHVLDLSEPIAQRPLAEGVELRCATVEDLALYEQLADPNDMPLAPGWLADGNDLWLAVSGNEVAFACWIFRRRMPMGQSRDGWLKLPEGVAFLEHSVTSANFRGKGIAPAAWSMVAERVRGEGSRTLFTKVTEENVVTQKSLAKVGFVRAERDDPVVREFARQGATG